MRKKFATNLLFLFAANLLVKPFWILGIDRVVQNRIGAQEYGTYFAVFNYSFLFSILLDFGINNFNNRAISRSPQRAGEYLINLMWVKGLLGIFYLGFTFISALSTGYSELQMKMLFFLALNQMLLSAILYFRSNIAALQLFKTDSLISIADRLLTIVFCLVLMYSSFFKNSFSLMWFIYAQTLALLITSILACWVVAGRTVLKFSIWKFKFTKLILLKSMPFALLALLMGIYYRIDAVMIERMLPNGAHEAGIYAASFRLLDALNMFGYLFATLLLPMFAGMIRRKENVNQLVKFSSELMFVMAVIAGVNCYFFRSQIMTLLYTDSNNYWAEIFGWLMLNFIPMSSVYIFGTLLTANGSLKILNFIAGAGVIVNVALNLFLIPRYGAFGATIATLITQFFTAAIHILSAQKQFKFKYELKDLMKLSLFLLSSIVLLFFIRMSPLHWTINLLFSSSACLVAAVFIGLVPFQKALSLMKSKVAS